MIQLIKITANSAICEELIALGIKPVAVLWHVKQFSDGDEWAIEASNQLSEYEPGEYVPAWTKEELDIMIGGDVMAPRLPGSLNTRIVNKIDGDKTKAVKEYAYHFYEVEKMLSWRPTKAVKNPGATASAEILKRALAEAWITAYDANERYKQFFINH